MQFSFNSRIDHALFLSHDNKFVTSHTAYTHSSIFIDSYKSFHKQMEHLVNDWQHVIIKIQSEIYGLELFPASPDLQTFNIASTNHIQTLEPSVEYLKLLLWFKSNVKDCVFSISNDKITNLACYTFRRILELIPSKKMKFDCKFRCTYMFIMSCAICGIFAALCLDYLESFVYNDLGESYQTSIWNDCKV